MERLQWPAALWRRTSALRNYALLLASAVALGGVVWGTTLAAEHLVAPPWLEPAADGAYRVSFMLRLPVMVLTLPLFPSYRHHEVRPALFTAVTSFCTPFFWLAVAGVARRIWGGYRPQKDSTAAVPKPTAPISRRSFMVLASSAVTVPGALGGYSLLVEPQRLRIARYTVPIRGLPGALDGFRIVHVSDTHYGPFVSLRYLRAAIEQANALEGDIVVLTGDYVHRTPLAIGPGVDALKRLRPRLGVVATLGNHDHWEGADAVRAAFAETRIPLIDNSRRFVTRDGIRDGAITGKSICLGGVGDLWEDQTDFARALEDAPDAMPRIVLAHNPDTAEKLPVGTRVDLMCSGHTHGGQVWVPGFGTPILPSAFGQKYAGGLCAGPQCPVVVSRGVGMAIMPVRFGVRPEIGEITLVRA